MTRLSVNVAVSTQAALDRIVEREGVTLTEALRRLVAAGNVIYRATAVDGDELLIRRGEATERVTLIV